MEPQPIALGALIAATFITAALPGPCAVMAAGRSAHRGARAGLAVSLGVLAGHSVLICAALLLILFALALPGVVFQVMKWAGVLALFGVGVSMLLPPAAGRGREGRHTHTGEFVGGLMVALLSPHALIFVIALLPQFLQSPQQGIAPALLPAAVFLGGAQMTQLGATTIGASVRTLAGCRWVDYAGAATLFAFAGVAVLSATE